MAKVKIKPPAESKTQLMIQVSAQLSVRYQDNPTAAIEYLLSFFTAADLVGIREELRGQ